MKKLPVDVGRRINQLTIIEDLGIKQHLSRKIRMVKVKCDCGQEKDLSSTYLLGLRPPKTCGCKSNIKNHNLTHGLSKHPLYRLRRDIINRCTNKNVTCYRWYGGRGIKVCNEWLNDFMSFYTWTLNSGWERGLQIDRINVDGDYEPSNCRFVRQIDNARNKTDSAYITYRGQTKCMSEWAEYFDIGYKLLHQRLRRDKLDFETAITKPLRLWPSMK